MHCIADLYSIGLSSSQLVVFHFCGAIKKKIVEEIHQLDLSFHYGKICTEVPRHALDFLRGGDSGWLSHTHRYTPIVWFRLLQSQRIPFNLFTGHDVNQMFVLEFLHRLGVFDARCQPVG
jgi:hypothetical protein